MRNPFTFEPEPFPGYLGIQNDLEARAWQHLEQDSLLSIDPQVVGWRGELDPAVDSTAPGSQIDHTVTQLAKEWSDRRKGTPSVQAMTTWLRRDHQDTLAGARLRWRKGQYPTEAISRAWAISRAEQMRFQIEMPSGLRKLRNFAPPSQPVSLVSSPLINDSDKAPVAPLVVRFVQELRKRYQNFDVWNYRGHGGGQFRGRGFSLDFAIPGRDARGFYPPADAIKFLRAVHEVARAVGAEWRVLYNDFSVALALNRETGFNHVFFMGTVRRTGKAVAGLNWHGPHPLILHFHLDLAPASSASSSEIPGGATSASSRTAPARPANGTVRPKSGGSTGVIDPEVVHALRIAQRAVPGMPGTTTESLLERWRPRICPEIPLPILLAFINYESGGRFSDATHGTDDNRWTKPVFYELGIFQTPAGLHGRCTSGKWQSCEFGPPGRETTQASTWKRLCAKIGADPEAWQNPTTQVRVGLADIENGAIVLRKAFPELFPRPGSDWDLRMAVLFRFAQGGGYARSFLTPFRRQLAALPEDRRWAFLRDKSVTVAGKDGPVRRRFKPENVDKKMVLAAKIGYVPLA